MLSLSKSVHFVSSYCFHTGSHKLEEVILFWRYRYGGQVDDSWDKIDLCCSCEKYGAFLDTFWCSGVVMIPFGRRQKGQGTEAEETSGAYNFERYLKKLLFITVLKFFSNKELWLLFQTALAHLESLAVDVEVANPPASKESIDGLPETLVLEDHTGKGKVDLSCQITYFMFSYIINVPER